MKNLLVEQLQASNFGEHVGQNVVENVITMEVEKDNKIDLRRHLSRESCDYVVNSKSKMGKNLHEFE